MWTKEQKCQLTHTHIMCLKSGICLIWIGMTKYAVTYLSPSRSLSNPLSVIPSLLIPLFFAEFGYMLEKYGIKNFQIQVGLYFDLSSKFV